MKILLINSPDAERPVSRDMAGGLGFDRNRTMLLPPLELLGYATHLESRGHEVLLLDAQAEMMDAAEINAAACEFVPDAVILTLSLPTIEADMAFCRQLRQSLGDKTIAVKTGISHSPALDRILRESGCSFCITGECDTIIDRLITGESNEGTARLVNGELSIVPERLFEELDALPIPDRSKLKNELYGYPRLGTNITTMQTSRGCPFSCSYYCPYPLVQGKKWRAMSAARIYKELEHIVNIDKIDKILFRDATFSLNKNRIRELCGMIKEGGLKFSWWAETRIDCLDMDLVKEMQECGCLGLNVGVETGDEDVLKSHAKQGLSIDDIANITAYSRQHGFRLHFLLMLGLPGETRQSLYKTFRLVEQMKPESLGITTVTPYPGTLLYEDAVKHGWIVNNDPSAFGGHGMNMRTDDLEPEDIKFALDMINNIAGFSRNNIYLPDARVMEKISEFEEWAGI